MNLWLEVSLGRRSMSKIIITLNKNDIGNLLLGGEISTASQGIVIKYDEYDNHCTIEEDFDD